MSTNKTWRDHINKYKSLRSVEPTFDSTDVIAPSLVVGDIDLTPVLDIVTDKYEMKRNMQEYKDLDTGLIVYSDKRHEGTELELVLETAVMVVYKYRRVESSSAKILFDCCRRGKKKRWFSWFSNVLDVDKSSLLYKYVVRKIYSVHYVIRKK